VTWWEHVAYEQPQWRPVSGRSGGRSPRAWCADVGQVRGEVDDADVVTVDEGGKGQRVMQLQKELAQPASTLDRETGSGGSSWQQQDELPGDHACTCRLVEQRIWVKVRY
jgi:hypothetical protein